MMMHSIHSELRKCARELAFLRAAEGRDMLLTSQNLSDFLSRTVEKLQEKYGGQKERHKAALELIREKVCDMIVKIYHDPRG
jgi:hypothetical protein